MARENFDQLVQVIIENEGGSEVVKHPDDPGGQTKYGITVKTYLRAIQRGILPMPAMVACEKEVRDEVERDRLTTEDVLEPHKAMSRKQAERIYRVMYWMEAGCHEMPQGFDLAVFDAAVNHGPSSAVKMLQRALNAVLRQEDVPAKVIEPLAKDGIWGPRTRNALAELKGDPEEDAQILREFHLRRFLSWHGLKKAAFTKGWFRRGLKMLQDSSYLATDGTMLYLAKRSGDAVKIE